MPIYEYRCRDCGSQYEQLRRMSEAERNLECPQCASSKVDLLLSAFATGGCATSSGRFT
ncbi:MAG: zinc ribbon domain-containing protein [Acidimicrobiia bacterium]|nr:zinc ribbon domain-containing protein [Acidimicrobiia bacterium]